jgi:hypothetical protein
VSFTYYHDEKIQNPVDFSFSSSCTCDALIDDAFFDDRSTTAAPTASYAASSKTTGSNGWVHQRDPWQSQWCHQK